MRLTALLLLLGSAAWGQAVDDSDLSDPAAAAASERAIARQARLEGKTLVFAAGAAPLKISRSGPRAVSGRLELSDRAGGFHPARLARVRLLGPQAGGWSEVGADGRFSLPAPGPGSYRLRYSLNNRYWSFQNPKSDAAYEFESAAFVVPAEGGVELGWVRAGPDTEAAKLGVLHLTYLEALAFLGAQAKTDWWKKTLTVNWPGQADFFSPWAFSLDLTNPLAWDVVLHELGHAVMHAAMKAEMGGGQHKIDECYSANLAWSEGWATFFAGAVRLSPEDPDARFEFLVPRRAPIRVENVPEDVCKGQTNEWRVAAGLWDLYDRHQDGGDKISLGFARLWSAFTGGATKSLETAWALVASGLNPLERKAGENALAWNTVLAPRAERSLALSRPADFDGRGQVRPR